MSVRIHWVPSVAQQVYDAASSEQLSPLWAVQFGVFWAGILCAAAALVAAAPARGAVAIQGERCAGSFCNGVVTYLAEPGENNVFSTRATSMPTEMLLLDAGAAIRGCPPVEGGVRCSNYSGVVYAHLGDGDDQGIGATEFWRGPGKRPNQSRSPGAWRPG